MAQKNLKKITAQAQTLIEKTQQRMDHPESLVDDIFLTSKQLYQQGEIRVSRQLLEQARQVLKHKAEQWLKQPLDDEIQILALTKKLKGLNEPALARQLLSQQLERLLGVQGQASVNLKTPISKAAADSSAQFHEINDPAVKSPVVAELSRRDSISHVVKQVAQQLALNTYKDDELPPDDRYAEALSILDSIGLRRADCEDPETLGQAGAIYKRKFERSGRVEDLQAAFYFYQRGWLQNPEKDLGYCGINAAFVLDRLAHRARLGAAMESIPDSESPALLKQAQELRRQILTDLPNIATAQNQSITNQWWYLVTMAEAAFGLGEWTQASDFLQRASQVEHFEWERQTTAKQLVSIARMHGYLPPTDDQAVNEWDPPWQALSQLLGANARAAFESFRGKVGLALSGGGFRASLYHLGVLARLAEVDALRSIEVLSTVSGGSIVGAHYYLALQKLLTEKTDEQITRDDYIQLVRSVIEQFFAGVSENLRVRALASLPDNFRMLFESNYGRSNRMGELYEQYFFQKADKPKTDQSGAGLKQKMRPMHALRVHPLTPDPINKTTFIDDSFRPQVANWSRLAKVPTLLLNTTSLNSGHNWHFTASFMGEPPGLMGQDIDMNQRYRRLYYWQAPNEKLQHYPLGYAVAASAGVPALFDPLELSDLYPERTVRLVDGGVHDNQGVAGLLDEGCDLILCSDASGQMDDQSLPKKSPLSVFFRSDSILQDRVREAQYQALAAKAKNNALQGLFFIHLKQELDSDPLNWINCQQTPPSSNRPQCTGYGIDRDQQRRLADVRTDLDTFTEVEAYALMASGYAMTTYQLKQLDQQHQALKLPGNWADFDIFAPAENWPFSPIMPILAADPESTDPQAQDLKKQLTAAKLLAGKAWVLIPALKYAGIATGTLLLIALFKLLKQNWQDETTITIGVAGITTALLLTILGALLPFGKYLQPLDTARKWLGLAVLGSFGWAASNIHLLFFDKWFKERGKLQRLLNLK